MPTFLPNEPQNGETVDADLLRNQFNALNDSITAIPAGPAGPAGAPGPQGAPGTDADPIVGAVIGIVKADGAGTITAATDGTDYWSPTSLANVTPEGTDLLIGTSPHYGAYAAGNVLITGGGFRNLDAFYAGGGIHLTAGAGGSGIPCVFQSEIQLNAGLIEFNVSENNAGAASGVILMNGVVATGAISAPAYSINPATQSLLNTDGSTQSTWATGTFKDGSGNSYLKNASGAEIDPVVGAVTGIVKADGAGTITAATPGTDYLTPNTSADGTYPVANDGATSGQLASITIANGLITGVTVVP